MLFWIALAALIAITLIGLLRPLLSSRHEVSGGSAQDVFAAQLDELQSDRERGVISEADAEATRVEIARRLLRTRDARKTGHDQSRRRWITATLVGFFVPAFSLGAYFVTGAPSERDQPLAARVAPIDPARLASMVAEAEARLAINPSDGEGWAAIAPAYQQLRRFSDAAAAYARANTLLGPDANRLTGQGEALALVNNGTVTPEAHALFEQALALEPQAISPAIFLAIAARQAGDFPAAAERWRALIERSDGTEPWLQVAVAEFQRMSGGAPDGAAPPAPPGAPSASAPGSAPAPLPGPTSEQMAAAAALSPDAQAMMVRNMVSQLADRLARDGGSAQEWARLVQAYRVLGEEERVSETLEAARAALSDEEYAVVYEAGEAQ